LEKGDEEEDAASQHSEAHGGIDNPAMDALDSYSK
jgi:hypothetical protein